MAVPPRPKPLPWRAGLVLLVAMALLPARADTPGGAPWKFDVLYLKNGRAIQGLLVKQDQDEIVFKRVSRKPGSPTVVSTYTLFPAEVDHIEALDAEERKILAERLQTLARERELSQALRKAIDPIAPAADSGLEDVEYRSVPWGKAGKGKALRYEAAHFQLVSNARVNVVDLAAVHLEQIYAAYTRLLPPRCLAARPTLILLPRSIEDYQALLQERGRNLLNPAFYDPARNQIVCASELQRLSDAIRAVCLEHQEMRKRLQQQEDELKRIYKGKIPAVLANQIIAARQQIQKQETHNQKGFEAAVQRLFQRLYHEAFHAYLANFVYPPAEAEVPLWLNEGLAQIFESALVEGGELRVDHADPGKLKRTKDLAAAKKLVSLAELLRSGPNEFLVIHGRGQQASDRYYLTSWALAFYLTFERKLLGTEALDRYVHSLHRGAEPLGAFEELVGDSLGRTEEAFHAYLDQLRPDGRKVRMPIDR